MIEVVFLSGKRSTCAVTATSHLNLSFTRLIRKEIRNELTRHYQENDIRGLQGAI